MGGISGRNSFFVGLNKEWGIRKTVGFFWRTRCALGRGGDVRGKLARRRENGRKVSEI